MTIEMNNLSWLLLILFLLNNIIALMVMLYDKHSSYSNRKRIGEGVLFFWAAFFGSIGIYAGMYLVRHKTKKWYFTLGMPLMVFQNIVVLFLLYRFLINLI